MSNELDKFLNIAAGETLPAVIEKKITTQVNADFEFARENMMEVINKGQEALFDLMDVAKQSQHPRAYEVLATMMSTMVGASKDLLDLQAKKEKDHGRRSFCFSTTSHKQPLCRFNCRVTKISKAA